MAQLKDTVVSGNLRVTDTVLTKDVETDTINGSTPITSGNIGSQSVNYANSAGSASSASYASSAGSAPASDVYDGAKASSKPSYSWSEINSRPTALSSFTNDVGYITSYTDTNTWRPITNTYTGSDQSTSVSQYGTNALYNALVNGYASTAGDAATVSGHTVAKDVPADAVFTDTNTWPSYTSQLTNNSGFITASDSCAYATSAGSASSATTASTANALSGFENNNSSGKNANDVTYNAHTYYVSNGPSTSLGASTDDGALYSQAYSTSWVGQIAQDYRNGRLFVRGKNNGTWQNGNRVALYSEIPSSLPASDVYSGAKASSKPSYSWSEIGSRPTALSSFTNDSGYITGITKTMVTNALGYTPPTSDTNTGRPLGTTADTACAGNDSRLSDARPASDVYSWAKASSKPSYSYSEISNTPSSLPASDVYSGAKASSKPSYDYSEISNTPSSLPASDVYDGAKASSKPSYSYSEITGAPSIGAAASYGVTTSVTSGSTDLVTSGGVYSVLGNIETLLAAI